MRSMAGLRIDGLTVSFGSHEVLHEVSLAATAGELLLLTGPSGSGKTTLLRCCNGLIPHVFPARMAGSVVVDGLDTRFHEVSRLAQRVGFVFQNPEAQLFNLTVGDEVLFAPRCAGLDPSQAEQQARWALEATGIAHLERRRLATLSGGEKQRVAIAAVLALRPSILILDEPTAHLDVPGARVVLGTLERLCREEGLTVVVGEHRTGAVGRFAGRLIVLEAGHLLADGPPRQVFARQELIYRLGIRRPADEPEEQWEHLIGTATPSQALPPLAELSGVEAGYGKEAVLHGVDLALYPGEVVALVGDNGAGKTTVARLLTGLLPARKGSILVGGRKPSPHGGEVGLVLQNPLAQLFCETVEEEVSFGPANLGRLQEGAVEDVLAANDLLPLRRQPVQWLSCGQQQRTVVASVLALRPRLLILDEPTMGQDWNHLAAMMAYLRQLVGQGHAVLLITHDYKLVHRYADRVVLLREGRVAADGRLLGKRERTAQPAAMVVGE